MAQPFAIQSATGCDPADEWIRLGVELHSSGKLDEAIDKYHQALRIDPRSTTATLNLAVSYAQSPGRLNDAILAIERAYILDNKSFVILTAMCLIYLEAGHVNEAIIAGERAVVLIPGDSQGNHARYALALCWPTEGHPERAIPLYEDIMKYEPQHCGGPNLCFVETLLPMSPKEILPSRKRWYDANRYKGEKKPHSNNRNPDRPLRVGYVSGDFKSHSAAFIFSRVVLGHSDSVIPYFYSTLPVEPDKDDRTKVFMDKVGHTKAPQGEGTFVGRWRDIFNVSDSDADDLIRKDEIDILVDLSGHTGGGRLALFSRKPAPIQMTGWGFAHGTGVAEIDYFLADPIVVPKHEHCDFVEKIIDLPCVVTFNPPTWYNTRASSPAPYKRNGYITFGSYSRYEKLSDECLKAYKKILIEVPDSKLELKDAAFSRPDSIRRVLEIMSPEIEQERLLFSIHSKHVDHMRTYQQADLCLDPFPHGGGVVAIEQLYMGVPLVTLYGTQPAGRTAASILTLMNRIDWIAFSIDQYIEKAVGLASNPKELTDARKVLRQELVESPVVKCYVKAVEAAYRTTWQKWCKS